MTHRARARLTGQTVEVLVESERVATLSCAEAVALAIEMFGAVASGSAVETYGSITWLSVGQVETLLRLPRKSASRLMRDMRTAHRRRHGGDWYVARAEVEATVARWLGVDKRRVA